MLNVTDGFLEWKINVGGVFQVWVAKCVKGWVAKLVITSLLSPNTSCS